MAQENILLPPKITLEAARVNAHMQQKAAAKHIGVTPSTLRSWENGKTVPNYEQAVTLCRLYGYPIQFIIFGSN